MSTIVNHYATPGFRECYRQLQPEVRELAEKNFDILRRDPHHPSLRLKRVGVFWSARVGLTCRALAKERSEGLVWFWIGSHADYELLIAR